MHILVIDDDKNVRDLTAAFLSTFSHEVIVFEEECCAGAITRLRKSHHCIDAIICDFNMPGGNGDEVYLVWRELCAHIPFIFFSADVSAAKKSIKEYKHAESTLFFLDKTGDLEDLEIKVRKSLKHGLKPIAITSIIPDEPILCDLYLLIGERKFLKVINNQDSITREKLDTFMAKGEVSFYIKGETILEKKWRYPNYQIHNFESLSISQLMESFKRTFSKRLGENLNQVRFNSVCSRLGKTLASSQDIILKETLSKLKGRDNYVLDHSLLLCTLSIMAIEELGISSPRNREIIIRSSLFHNLLLDDGTAFILDVLPNEFWKLNSLEKWNKNEKMSILKKMTEWDFTSNEEAVIGALINQMSYPEGELAIPHRLASVCLKVHEFISELYRCDFQNIEGVMQEKFNNSEEVTLLFQTMP